MHSVNNHHPRHHIFWCSNTDQVETGLVCNAFIRINRRTNNWHSLNQWRVTGMKVENCVSQEDFLFGDDDLRIHGKLSVCPLRTRDLSLAIHAAQGSTNALLKEELFAEIINFICKLSRHQFKDGCPTSSTERNRIILKAVFISENSYRKNRVSISVSDFLTRIKTLVLNLKWKILLSYLLKFSFILGYKSWVQLV